KPRELCKFNTCTHIHEPGCGVIAAFENGEIDPNRYHSYINMLESLEN
ncbi:MAG TPA: ribosome small subunit-dependent GTPase A, partial [Balneola sp.]|nr:ribosome small subunit-dependent GTPase A [Balneola sp.]